MPQIHSIVRLKRAKGFLNHPFCRREDGATAIEFAMLAPLFFLIIFALLDMGMRLMTARDMDMAIMSTSRTIRTGQFTGKSLQDFQELFCSKLSSFSTCTKFAFQVDKLKKFSEIETLPKFKKDKDTGEVISTYADSASGDVVVIRVTYKHKSLIPNLLHMVNGESANIISSVTLFQNEPF